MATGKRIIVAGTRSWADAELIADVLRHYLQWYGPDTTIVHGASRDGAEALVDRVARELGFRVERHPAQWDLFGRSARHRSYATMVERGADLCLAFADRESRALDTCTWLAEDAGIPVLTFHDAAVVTRSGEPAA